MTYDGVVSRYLNRPLSRPAARALAHTPVTPNAVTGFTLLLACVAGAALALGWNVAGGVGIQLVSVIDGVDGELARLKNMATRFGEVFDAVGIVLSATGPGLGGGEKDHGGANDGKHAVEGELFHCTSSCRALVDSGYTAGPVCQAV